MTAVVFGVLLLTPLRAGAEGVDATAPYYVLCLTEGGDGELWPEQVAHILNDGARRRLYIFLQRPTTPVADTALSAHLDWRRPDLVLARHPPSPAVAAALRARGLPLLLLPDSADARKAASAVLERAADRDPVFPVNDAARLEAWRRLARLRRELYEDFGASADWSRVLTLAPTDQEAWREKIAGEMKEDSPWIALKSADAWVAAAAGAAARAEALRIRALLRLRLQGDADGAAKDLQEALPLSPPDWRNSLRLALALRQHPRQALPHAEGAARQAPTRRARAQALLVEAELRQDLGDAATALRLLRRAAALHPTNLDGWAALARAETTPTRRLRAAQSALEAAERLPLWLRAAAYRFCARLWLDLGEHPRAVESLRLALDIDDEDKDAWEMLAALKQRDPAAVAAWNAPRRRRPAPEPPAACEAELQRALEADPEDLSALHALSRLLLAQRRRSEAIAVARKFLDAVWEAPFWQRPSAYVTAAPLWIALGNALQARNIAELARRLDLRSNATRALPFLVIPLRPARWRDQTREEHALASSYIEMAQARRELDDAAGALRMFDKALALVNDDLRALGGITEIQLSLGRLAEAQRSAERLVASARDGTLWQRAMARRLRGRVRLELGRKAAAIADFKEVLRLIPGDSDALQYMSQLGARRDARVGRRDANRAVEAAYDTPAPPAPAPVKTAPVDRTAQLLDRGEERAAAGDNAAAVAALEAALALAPGQTRALRLLVEIHARRDPAAALPYADALLHALRQAPPAERAAQLRRRARLRLAVKDAAGARADIEASLALAPADLDSLWLFLEAAAPPAEEALRLLEARLPGAARGEWLALRGLVRAPLDESAARAELSNAVAQDPDAVCFAEPFVRRRERLPSFYFDLCLKHFPKKAELYQSRGVARFLARQREEALADFRAALLLDPTNADARASLSAAEASQP